MGLDQSGRAISATGQAVREKVSAREPGGWTRSWGGKLFDLSYIADVITDNGWKYNLRLGPMERRQWFQIIPYERAIFAAEDELVKYKESFGERMLFIDLDSFQEEMPWADVPQFLDSVRAFSTDLMSKMVQYLKG